LQPDVFRCKRKNEKPLAAFKKILKLRINRENEKDQDQENRKSELTPPEGVSHKTSSFPNNRFLAPRN